MLLSDGEIGDTLKMSFDSEPKIKERTRTVINRMTDAKKVELKGSEGKDICEDIEGLLAGGGRYSLFSEVQSILKEYFCFYSKGPVNPISDWRAVMLEGAR